MNKKLGIFLAVSFLAVQMFALLHMAEHGFKEHKHNGKTCSIYLYGEQAKFFLNSTVVPVVSEPTYTFFEIRVYKETDVHSIDFNAASPRAPPTFS